MSQRAETRIFDIFVVILFVLVVGWLAMHSSSPRTSSLPGVTWPSAPEPRMLQDAKVIVEGDPLPPDASDTTVVGEPAPQVLDGSSPTSDNAPPADAASEGDWQ
jgi:hypothetical protein